MKHRSSTFFSFWAFFTLAACSKSDTTTVSAPATEAPAATAPAKPAEFTINISPTWTVGQKFGYTAEDTTTTPDGKTHIEFSAEGQVLALSIRGNPQQIAYTVKTLQVDGPGPLAAQLPGAGSVITIEYADNHKRITTFDGKAADPEIADFLEALLWITYRNHADQEIYGSSAPVAIGATWPINDKAFLDYDEEGDPHYDNIMGMLTLQTVEGSGAIQRAIITGSFTVKGQNPPSDPGSFTNEMKFTASVPLSHKGVYREIMASNITLTPIATSANADATASGPTVMQDVTTQEVEIK